MTDIWERIDDGVRRMKCRLFGHPADVVYELWGRR